MKLGACLFIFALAITGSSGCNKKPAPQESKAKKFAEERKIQTGPRFGSIAVLPFTGDMGEDWSRGKEANASKIYLERTLPEAIVREIIKKRPSESPVKVIAPAVVEEKRKADTDLKSLGKLLEVKTLLVGKATPNSLRKIDFQLIVADTGELLWSDALPCVTEADGSAVADVVLKQLIAAGNK